MGWTTRCINCGKKEKLSIKDLGKYTAIFYLCSKCDASEYIRLPEGADVKEVIEEKMGGEQNDE